MVVSSPRGGSSHLAELLRGCPSLLHLPGETPPLLTLAGLDPLSRTGCEELGAADAADFAEALDREFAREAGAPADRCDLPELAAWLHRRLTMQWPDETFETDEVAGYVAEATAVARLPERAAEFGDLAEFHLEFLAAVRAAHPRVDPYYYDLDEDLVTARFPGLDVPQAPHQADRLVEVAPFLIARPWRLADPDELAGRTLVIKAPGCSYQIPFFRALFPHARVRILHLTRAPGPSINGLMIAWLHRGFFSRTVPEELAIGGYSDVHPEWGDHWWNFDLPPGWTDMTKEPLEAVCAFQWASAHRAVGAEIARSQVDHLTVRHEDLVGSGRKRHAAVHRLGCWLGLSSAEIERLATATIDPVSATAKPDENRWKRNAHVILPAMRAPHIREVASDLGYHDFSA
ncbi:hypothetical protein [Actinoplanes couchii]|uniref:Sulfotransferase n=1 Tax=Actinoplanes couchii TaxID=403638 RepID=A0ABQ3XSP1_9ACTN|nr:hypothetical protein [Actinoplanes couchii]MDR6315970.1 hypothetical protein [Actinoplanes couchii]GID61488.1 hypothetical protein Aco03nite_098920 [Actinoplanes couchii]